MQGPIPDELKSDLQSNVSEESIQALEENDEFKRFVDEYVKYTDETLAGTHGSTAKYWMLYMQLVVWFLRFNRSCSYAP